MDFIIGFVTGIISGFISTLIIAICNRNAYSNQIEEQERIKAEETMIKNSNDNLYNI